MDGSKGIKMKEKIAKTEAYIETIRKASPYLSRHFSVDDEGRLVHTDHLDAELEARREHIDNNVLKHLNRKVEIKREKIVVNENTAKIKSHIEVTINEPATMGYHIVRAFISCWDSNIDIYVTGREDIIQDKFGYLNNISILEYYLIEQI